MSKILQSVLPTLKWKSLSAGLCLRIIPSLAVCSALSGQSVNLAANADTYIRPGTNFENTNYEGEARLQAGSRQIYLKFDVSQVQAGNDVRLQLEMKYNSSSIETFSVYGLPSADNLDGWNVSNLTWANRPAPDLTNNAVFVGTLTTAVNAGEATSWTSAGSALADLCENPGSDGLVTLVIAEGSGNVSFRAIEDSAADPLLVFDAGSTEPEPVLLTLESSNDTYVRSGSQFENNTHGSLSRLQVATGFEIYIQYDLSAANGQTVSDANLEFMTKYTQSADQVLSVYVMKDSLNADGWNENTLTWVNRPAKNLTNDAVFIGNMTALMSPGEIVTLEGDHSALINAINNPGTDNLVTIIVAGTTNEPVEFESFEGGGGGRPFLNLMLGGPSTAGPVSGDYHVTALADTYVRSGTSFGDTNFEGEARLLLGPNYRAYVKFSPPANLAAATVDAALEMLTKSTTGNVEAVNVYGLKTILDEDGWDPLSLTWNNQPVDSLASDTVFLGTLYAANTANERSAFQENGNAFQELMAEPGNDGLVTVILEASAGISFQASEDSNAMETPALVVSLTNQSPTDIWIDPTSGMDSLENSGNSSQPWASLPFAVAQALPGDTIYLASGVHTLNEELAIRMPELTIRGEVSADDANPAILTGTHTTLGDVVAQLNGKDGLLEVEYTNNVHIRDILFDGASVREGTDSRNHYGIANAIEITGSTGVLVEDLIIKDFINNAFAARESSFVEFRDSFIENCGFEWTVFSLGAVSMNNIYDSKFHGLTLRSDQYGSGYGFKFSSQAGRLERIEFYDLDIDLKPASAWRGSVGAPNFSFEIIGPTLVGVSIHDSIIKNSLSLVNAKPLQFGDLHIYSNFVDVTGKDAHYFTEFNTPNMLIEKNYVVNAGNVFRSTGSYEVDNIIVRQNVFEGVRLFWFARNPHSNIKFQHNVVNFTDGGLFFERGKDPNDIYQPMGLVEIINNVLSAPENSRATLYSGPVEFSPDPFVIENNVFHNVNQDNETIKIGTMTSPLNAGDFTTFFPEGTALAELINNPGYDNKITLMMRGTNSNLLSFKSVEDDIDPKLIIQTASGPVTVYAEMDSYVRSGSTFEEVNYGGEKRLQVDQERIMILRFDLSGFTQTATTAEFVMALKYNESVSETIDVYTLKSSALLDGSWDSDTVTWKNTPVRNLTGLGPNAVYNNNLVGDPGFNLSGATIDIYYAPTSATSLVVNAGQDLGLDYNGPADIGAFESNF